MSVNAGRSSSVAGRIRTGVMSLLPQSLRSGRGLQHRFDRLGRLARSSVCGQIELACEPPCLLDRSQRGLELLHVVVGTERVESLGGAFGDSARLFEMAARFAEVRVVNID